LTRSFIKKVSAKEKERQIIYAKQKQIDEQTEQSCKRCFGNINLERHHVSRRADILAYIYICQDCHRWVHANPKEARKEGLLV